MIHAALPNDGHRKPFQKVAAAIGHAAPFTQLNPTDAFFAWAQPLIDEAGPYPHAQLKAFKQVGAPKKQTARLLKAECPCCGYVVRVTSKWVNEVGAPHCPAHGEMTVEGSDGD
jgi:hypothetical protein